MLVDEVIILKGSGRGSAPLFCDHGIDVIPEHNGPKSGKRIVGLRVGGSSSVELYIEAEINGPYREFYYDSTISLRGAWKDYEDQTGFYDTVLSWQNADEAPFSVVSEISSPANSYSVETYPGEVTGPGKAQDFGYVSEAVLSTWGNWDELDDEVKISIAQARSRVSLAKTVSTRRVEVIRSKAERKLALDKDI